MALQNQPLPVQAAIAAHQVATDANLAARWVE